MGEEASSSSEQAELLHEQELAALERASEERYRQLADAMPQIVWTADADGGATYFNRRWFEYTGMTPEEAGPNVVAPGRPPRRPADARVAGASRRS